ncbi:hypothetical protein C8R44DRAFT_853263 [Mycena epipterygia]|nr:hypothetical protein C8R44DRAFT_853263 [Mycena epipterygia]
MAQLIHWKAPFLGVDLPLYNMVQYNGMRYMVPCSSCKKVKTCRYLNTGLYLCTNCMQLGAVSQLNNTVPPSGYSSNSAQPSSPLLHAYQCQPFLLHIGDAAVTPAPSAAGATSPAISHPTAGPSAAALDQGEVHVQNLEAEAARPQGWSCVRKQLQPHWKRAAGSG